jgi:hypothetical protein
MKHFGVLLQIPHCFLRVTVRAARRCCGGGKRLARRAKGRRMKSKKS